MQKFPCDPTCKGQCCKCLPDDGYLLELIGFNRGDGVCKYLVDGKCAIYDTRPDICRVDKMWAKNHQDMEWDAYVEMSLKMCEAIRQYNKARNR